MIDWPVVETGEDGDERLTWWGLFVGVLLIGDFYISIAVLVWMFLEN